LEVWRHANHLIPASHILFKEDLSASEVRKLSSVADELLKRQRPNLRSASAALRSRQAARHSSRGHALAVPVGAGGEADARDANKSTGTPAVEAEENSETVEGEENGDTVGGE
jgi:hypothetical protein